MSQKPRKLAGGAVVSQSVNKNLANERGGVQSLSQKTSHMQLYWLFILWLFCIMTKMSKT
jgi:hypothetical protein